MWPIMCTQADGSAVKNLNLVLCRKTKVGLVGPTGLCKTTIVNIMLGLFGC